jgi:hypothetical protein
MDRYDKKPERILGRRLARELTLEELEQATGGLAAAVSGVSTWTTSYPADGPYNDSRSRDIFV